MFIILSHVCSFAQNIYDLTTATIDISQVNRSSMYGSHILIDIDLNEKQRLTSAKVFCLKLKISFLQPRRKNVKSNNSTVSMANTNGTMSLKFNLTSLG